MQPRLIWILAVLLCIICHPIASADELGARRALIICGLSGNDELKEQFTDSITQIQKALVDHLGFAESNVHLQFGRDEESPVERAFPKAGRATREEIAKDVRQIIAQANEKDTTWVFVVGHAYFDGRNSFFNIPDTDFTQQQFGKLFAKLKGQSTFFICTPVSGNYVKELSKSNRVVISATDADAETNGSVFHIALAQAFTEFTKQEAKDIDKNGVVSLLDLYIRANRILSNLYLENDPPLIATEHPQLDDNADRRGSELQIDYLTIAQGGRMDAKRKRNIKKFADGQLAAQLPLDVPSQ